MRICITGFLGVGNTGDEGVLLAIMDSLGTNEYIVCTDLPYTMLSDYRLKLPACVVDVRQIYDIRDDYDVFLLGGGALGWGYGWRQAINAFSHEKPSMNYGVGYNSHQLHHPRMINLYKAFLEQFDAVTVRDIFSKTVAEGVCFGIYHGAKSAVVTGCPSLNLKEEAFDDCPEHMVAVCPRYEDYVSNEHQIKWLMETLQGVEDEVLLIPFAPLNSQNVPVDLALCLELKRKLKHSQIMQTDGFSPRQVKYAISKSKRVISGGRYHALAWASVHNVPFEVSPTSWRYPKINAFIEMHNTFGGEKLKEMERKNVEIFKELRK